MSQEKLAQFRQKLPLMQEWRHETLEKHAAQTRPVASYDFQSLPSYFPPTILNLAKVVVVENVPVPPLKSFGLDEFASYENGNYDGITYHDTYFLREGRERDESLHFHELVHVVQSQHLGFETFLFAYAFGFLRAGKYEYNPLEIMAYGFEAIFNRGLGQGDIEPQIKWQLDALLPVLLPRSA